MKPIAALTAVLFLGLAACGGPSEEDVLTPEKIRASESAPELPDVQLSENPEPPPAPPPPPEPELNEMDNMAEAELAEGVSGTIPPAFQGNWGLVASDCRQGAVVGTGMLVGPDSIVVADAAVSLQGVLDDSPSRFSGRFADDSGYEQREDLTLGGSGNVLTRTTNGQSRTYRRCGAGRPTG